MSNSITIEALPNVPTIVRGDDIGKIVLNTLKVAGFKIQENDVLCVASKAVSVAEGREISLEDIEVSDAAEKIYGKIPRKDVRTIQVMINETGKPDGSGLVVTGSHIAGWLPSGLRLTSAGVDKKDDTSVYLLPKDADASAKFIGHRILEATNQNVGVVITDSDGREDKRGATQVAVGVYGIPPLRVTDTEETICDMLAASAALVMGQRGAGRPIALIRGVEYVFDDSVSIVDATTR